MTQTVVLPTRVTFEEYRALPEGPPKYEFERGVLIPMTQPTPEHQDLLGLLWFTLQLHVRATNVGRVFLEPDVYLPDDRGYIPDIAFLSTANLKLYDPVGKFIDGAPDLAIEITSSRPSRDRIEKFQAYLANQVPWYWLIDPETLDLEEYRVVEGGYLRTASVEGGNDFRPTLFPGLTINLKKLVETGRPPLSDQL